MSEPHTINLQDAHVKRLIDSILGYIASNEFDDFIQDCVNYQLTLEQAREYVAWKAIELEFYIIHTGHPNAERHVLSVIKDCANKDDYEQLHPSLKIHG